MRTFVIEQEKFPDLPQLMLATLKALQAIGGSATVQELDEKVIELEGVTEEEQAIQMNNDHRPKLRYYLAWSRTYLKRGDALENSSRGVWTLTEFGEQISSRDETERIHNRVNEEEKERARAKRIAKRQSSTPPPEGDQEADPTEASEDDNNWQDNLLETLRTITPAAFERLSQRLLREAGFVKVEVRGATGDGGIDGVGVLRVNLVSFQIYFQCKRWKGSVGSKEIRDFRGAVQGRADKGLFITTGTFTSQASDEATRDGAIAIDLIDGQRLCNLLKQFELGVTTTMIENVEIDRTWFSHI